jgi:DnaK suppressor protein
MNEEQARVLLSAERARVEGLLKDIDASARDDRAGAIEQGDLTDSAQPLTAEEVDDAIATGLRERLAAVERAERRLEQGTFGYSVRSGQQIPDARLEADPTAELTVEEAAQA